jgi:hypothetical protein
MRVNVAAAAASAELDGVMQHLAASLHADAAEIGARLAAEEYWQVPLSMRCRALALLCDAVVCSPAVRCRHSGLGCVFGCKLRRVRLVRACACVRACVRDPLIG